MILEKIVLVLSSFIITAYVARYLGPKDFGYLSYLISFLSIGVVISSFGCNTLIFQVASKSIFLAKNIIKASQLIRIGILIIFLIYGIAFLFEKNEIGNQGSWLIIGLSISVLFQSLDCYSFYFDATLKSKFNFYANSISLIFALLMRFFLVFLGLPLAYFSLPYIINYAVSYFIKKYSYIKEKEVKSIKPKIIFPAVIKRALPLFLSEVSVLIYTRLTVLFVEYFKSISAVGGFSAVYTISGTWVIFPITIINSLFTLIYKERNSGKKNDLSQGVTIICFVGALALAALTYYFSETIILLIYGKQYIQFHHMLSIMMLSSSFSLVGYIGNRIIISYNGYSYLAKKMVFVAVISILLNIILIPVYGLSGAAYSMLLTEIFSATFANYLYKKGLIFKIHVNAIAKPVYSITMIFKAFIKA